MDDPNAPGSAAPNPAHVAAGGRDSPGDAMLDELIRWWFGTSGPAADTSFKMAWFVRDEAFDAEIKVRFEALAQRASNEPEAFDAWRRHARGVLGLMLLLDQFPRNLHRGTPLAFASDPLARAIASEAIGFALDTQVPFVARTFYYLPFEHSEELADQHRSVALFENLVAQAEAASSNGALPEKELEALRSALDYARRHLDVIERFNRFPHRNAALGRVTTDEEAAYLAAGGGF